MILYLVLNVIGIMEMSMKIFFLFLMYRMKVNGLVIIMNIFKFVVVSFEFCLR